MVENDVGKIWMDDFISMFNVYFDLELFSCDGGDDVNLWWWWFVVLKRDFVVGKVKLVDVVVCEFIEWVWLFNDVCLEEFRECVMLIMWMEI